MEKVFMALIFVRKIINEKVGGGKSFLLVERRGDGWKAGRVDGSEFLLLGSRKLINPPNLIKSSSE
jgi:hypothetical protein